MTAGKIEGFVNSGYYNGKTITRFTGYAILRAAGFETVDESACAWAS